MNDAIFKEAILELVKAGRIMSNIVFELNTLVTKLSLEQEELQKQAKEHEEAIVEIRRIMDGY